MLCVHKLCFQTPPRPAWAQASPQPGTGRKWARREVTVTTSSLQLQWVETLSIYYSVIVPRVSISQVMVARPRPIAATPPPRPRPKLVASCPPPTPPRQTIRWSGPRLGRRIHRLDRIKLYIHTTTTTSLVILWRMLCLGGAVLPAVHGPAAPGPKLPGLPVPAAPGPRARKF